MNMRIFILLVTIIFCAQACELRDPQEVCAQLHALTQRLSEDDADLDVFAGESKCALDTWLTEKTDTAEAIEPRVAAEQLSEDSQEESYGGRFGCRTCGARFETRALQNAHRIKTKHRLACGSCKPFDCALCGKKFEIYHSLKRHMIAHTHKTPHCCEQCGKFFSDLSNLRTHINCVHGTATYTCDFVGCGETFKTVQLLAKHQCRHYPERKPHQCSACSKRFTVIEGLRAHMYKYHGVVLPKRQRYLDTPAS